MSMGSFKFDRYQLVIPAGHYSQGISTQKYQLATKYHSSTHSAVLVGSSLALPGGGYPSGVLFGLLSLSYTVDSTLWLPVIILEDEGYDLASPITVDVILIERSQSPVSVLNPAT